MTVTAVSADNSDFQTRNSTEVSPRGLGYEYFLSSDLPGNAAKWADEAIQKLSAKPVDVGRYDLILHPTHLWLTIHESVAHPTELDRALGFEANYAGTSFVALSTGRRGFLPKKTVEPSDIAEAVSAADDLTGEPRLLVDLTSEEEWSKLGGHA